MRRGPTSPSSSQRALRAYGRLCRARRAASSLSSADNVEWQRPRGDVCSPAIEASPGAFDRPGCIGIPNPRPTSDRARISYCSTLSTMLSFFSGCGTARRGVLCVRFKIVLLRIKLDLISASAFVQFQSIISWLFFLFKFNFALLFYIVRSRKLSRSKETWQEGLRSNVLSMSKYSVLRKLLLKEMYRTEEEFNSIQFAQLWDQEPP